jgi:hypothetical protein
VATSPITPPPGYSVEPDPSSSLPAGYSLEGADAPPPAAGPSMAMSQVDMLGNPIVEPHYASAPSTGGNPIVNTIGGAAVGMVKSAAQSVLPGPKNTAAINSTLGTAMPAHNDPRLQANGTAEMVGKTAEDIGEFVTGDEALKSLSLGKRALEAAGLAEKYEKASPFVRKAIEHTMNAIRQGTTAGVETAVKTGDVKQGAEAGVAAGATSGLLSLVGEGIGAGAKAVKGALGTPELPVLAKAPVLPEAPKAPGVTPSLENVPNAKTVEAVHAKIIQPNLQNGIKQVLSDAADEIGVPKPAGGSFRDSAKELGDSVFNRSKGTFSKIDEATNGEFTNVDNKIKNLNKEMRLKAGVNDAADQLMGQQKQILEGKMQDLLESAKQNGVDPKIVDSARADYRRAQALYDLDAQIKKATLATSDPSKQLTNIKGLYTRLNGLSDSGRLSEAVGVDKAKALLSHAEDSQSALEQMKQRVADVGKQAKGQVAEHEASLKAAQAEH